MLDSLAARLDSSLTGPIVPDGVGTDQTTPHLGRVGAQRTRPPGHQIGRYAITSPSSSPAQTRARILVIGEALIDAVHTQDGSHAEHVGGSPANVAFGLAALGHPVRFATWLGPDDRGRRIAEHCARVGVELVPGSDGAERTSLAEATLDAAGAATYHFDIAWQVPPIDPTVAVSHVHTGSIAATLAPGGSHVVAAVRAVREHATVSYDPNMRPTLMGSPGAVRSRVEELVALADVVKASDEDIAWLYPGQVVSGVLSRWAGLGAALTVVTMGGRGAMYGFPSTGAFATIRPGALDVVDTVGAGDSFMAGLLSGLLDAGLLGGAAARERLRAAGPADVAPALAQAMSTAAVTVTRAGAYAPSRAELAQ